MSHLLIYFSAVIWNQGLPDSWNSGEDQSNSGDGFPDSKRKRRSRWSTNPEDKTVIPGMPTVIPSNLTESQQRQYVGRFS